MSTTVEEIEKTKISEDTKDELLLDSLEIKGYRCFEHLTIEKLGRVNLIVGKNNVGKTALLEALWIYAQGGHEINEYLVSTTILAARNERLNSLTPHVASTSFLTVDLKNSEDITTLRHLFYNRPSSVTNRARLRVSSGNGKSNYVEVSFQLPSKELLNNDSIRFDSNFKSKIQNEFISLNGLTLEALTALWDNIVLTDSEQLVVKSLHIILPQIVNINLIGYPAGSPKRVPIARIETFNEPVPLRSLGEGMSRLFGVTLSLVNCRDGMLMIDEIESGLHYSVLPDVWRLIFKTARDLNVQVFATTHSKDCVEAFAQAAYDSPEDGMLIRLERHDEKIVAKTIEEEMLVDAVNYEVEVR